MALTDPIADMLSRIMNGIRISADGVDIPSSKLKSRIAEILKSEGYISGFEESVKSGRKVLKLKFKFTGKSKNAINMMKRVSSPGRHIYVSGTKLPKVQSGFGTAVITTSKGVMPDREARKMKIGGEVLFYVW